MDAVRPPARSSSVARGRRSTETGTCREAAAAGAGRRAARREQIQVLRARVPRAVQYARLRPALGPRQECSPQHLGEGEAAVRRGATPRILAEPGVVAAAAGTVAARGAGSSSSRASHGSSRRSRAGRVRLRAERRRRRLKRQRASRARQQNHFVA